MQNYILCCGSTVDLTHEHLKSRNIEYIPFRFFLGDTEYVDDLGQTLPYSEFYAKMTEGVITKTSQINPEEYEAFFTPFLQNGKDVLYVSLSSGLSGTYNSALIAKETLSKQFPDRKIFIVDSLGASSGYGLLMDTLADLRDEGKTIEEVFEWAEEHKTEIHHWFFSTDLTYYVRGGRISKAMGWFGTIFKICPLLNVSSDGKLVPRRKIRTKQKVIQELVKCMEEYAENGTDYSGKCYICHAACIDDANEIKRLIEERFPALKDKVKIFDIGTTIGSHSGPGTAAVFFMGTKRVD